MIEKGIKVELARIELGGVLLARFDEFTEAAERSFEARRRLIEYIVNDPEDLEEAHDRLVAALEGWRAAANSAQARVEQLAGLLDAADA